MMKVFNVIVLCLLLAGCASPKKLLKVLGEASTDLPYVTPQHFFKSSDHPYAIHLDVSHSQNLQEITGVSKEAYWCVPLLFVNLWKADYAIHCGRDLISSNLSDHTADVFVTTLNSYGHYPFTQDETSRFRLEIEVEEIVTTGFYHATGSVIMAVYAYSYAFNEYLGPVETCVKAKYRLYDGDQLVFKSTCDTRDINPVYASMVNMNKKQASKVFVQGVVQSIDDCLSSLSSYVVQEASRVLDIHNDVTLRVNSY